MNNLTTTDKFKPQPCAKCGNDLDNKLEWFEADKHLLYKGDLWELVNLSERFMVTCVRCEYWWWEAVE